MVKVLGIDVDGALVARWRSWLMPEQQPFVVPASVARERGLVDQRAELSLEVADAFELYGVTRDDAIVLFDRRQARTLPAGVRRARVHRWPTRDAAADTGRTIRYVERGRTPSRHTEVRSWPIPGARELAGTFPAGSGPNCFGTVMEAAGVTGAAGEWMQIEPFDAWAAASTRPGGRDDQPGTVLIWRTTDGTPAHAAVTLGDGWALNKASQGWMSPAQVLPVREVIHRSRYRGLRLERRLLV
ncbi:hypothetical protein ET475_07720 [Microbacterium protaetiae]|uniref:NlpC/P60 domain-containing protein n=1 Tax=Microbacterium protaetiae TaxID=2509458 RepID=A0A4P6ECD6_9MICO|nr:hypothetical protein [Microbacterium protaetiae]QAY59890.1 hypothetical protein ET475_07720 [Microbacterium protaetiae]